LTHHTALSRLEYKIIHYESPDDRGIDVGMIYNPRTFSPLSSQAIRISFEHALQTNTRDILYVKGFANALADTIHVFVCHFPSRSGGVHNTEIKRIVAANTLRKVVDSIFTVHAPSNICIIGDFNDSPHDKSIQQILCAHTPDKLSHEKQRKSC
jgi:predicted extracellular nuclease